MKSEVTAIISTRERVNGILPTLSSFFEHTDVPYELIVVDGALPENIRESVEKLSAEKEFTFIHFPYPLSPNEARNIAIEKVNTPYVVFIDNDVEFSSEWLDHLLDTAKESGAALVGPLLLEGTDMEHGLVHAAAGDMSIDKANGESKFLFETHNYHDLKADIENDLAKREVSLLETHVILARLDSLQKIGGFDEGIMGYNDHTDLCLSVKGIGEKMIFEPNSVVCFRDPANNTELIEKDDLPYYLLRWSDDWNERSIQCSVKKWDLEEDQEFRSHAREWAAMRRRAAYRTTGIHGRGVGFIYYRFYTKDLVALRATKN